jgi:hypothetical protein
MLILIIRFCYGIYSFVAAMGRSQSTPGLVESRGRIPLEDMWVSPLEPLITGGSSLGPPPYSANSLFSPTLSPTSR